MDIAANIVVGSCLRKHREERHLTQRELAETLGKPQSYISKIEMGERGLSTPEFFDYTLALDGEYTIIAEEIRVGLIEAGYLVDSNPRGA